MANSKQMPSGNWRVQVFLGTNADGKKMKKSITAPTRWQAEMLAAEFLETVQTARSKFTVAQDVIRDLNKTYNSTRRLVVPAYIQSLIDRIPHQSETDFIVPLGYKYIKNHLTKLAKANGYQLTFHQLRHPNFVFSLLWQHHNSFLFQSSLFRYESIIVRHIGKSNSFQKKESCCFGYTMKKLVHNSVVGIIEHHIVNVPVTNEVTDHRMPNPLDLVGVRLCRTVFVKFVHLLHCSLACLLSFCGSAVVCRITLSFPTARSIFALPA